MCHSLSRSNLDEAMHCRCTNLFLELLVFVGMQLQGELATVDSEVIQARLEVTALETAALAPAPSPDSIRKGSPSPRRAGPRPTGRQSPAAPALGIQQGTRPPSWPRAHCEAVMLLCHLWGASGS